MKSMMNNQNTGHIEVTNCNLQEHGLGRVLLATLRSLIQPAAPQHIGMFAGSLLAYDLWALPSVPH